MDTRCSGYLFVVGLSRLTKRALFFTCYTLLFVGSSVLLIGKNLSLTLCPSKADASTRGRCVPADISTQLRLDDTSLHAQLVKPMSEAVWQIPTLLPTTRLTLMTTWWDVFSSLYTSDEFIRLARA